MMKFLVIGDSCIDKFVYGECLRLCPEAPVPIFTPLYTKTFDGMAGNVYNNVMACKRLFPDLECDLITNKNKPIKTRFVDNRTNQMIVRVDDKEYIEEIDKIPDINTYDAIIVSDYNKGFLKIKDLEYLSRHHRSFLDSKRILDNWTKEYSCIKINQFEYQQSKTYIDLFLDQTIVTNGISGCSYNNKHYDVPTPIETIDTSGAGDTFLATLAIHYTYNHNIDDAIMFAQECCGKVISKRGTATI